MKQAFISHSSKDRSVAKMVCAALEGAGIACWVAPRDVTPGQGYAGCIMAALSSCPLLIVILSRYANGSEHVTKEVERAVSRRASILTFRIEDVQPAGALEYFLSSEHWVDGIQPPLTDHLNALSDAVRGTLARGQAVADPRPAEPPARGPRLPDLAPDEWDSKRKGKLFGFMRSLFSDVDG